MNEKLLSGIERDLDDFLAVRFFFQAEDGIRDLYVTGVQTCALPIWALGSRPYPVAIEARLVPERLVAVNLFPVALQIPIGRQHSRASLQTLARRWRFPGRTVASASRLP